MTILVILFFLIILIEIFLIFKIKEKFFDLYYSNYELVKKVKVLHKSGDKEFFEIRLLFKKILKTYILILYPFLSFIFLCYLINRFLKINIINESKVFFDISNMILILIVGIFYYKARIILSKN
tara:strand:+ start:681 stop:1052 length:372 start_codon:yes stop_codon:yes gene_type:complete